MHLEYSPVTEIKNIHMSCWPLFLPIRVYRMLGCMD